VVESPQAASESAATHSSAREKVENLMSYPCP
jgi:hypothetical protein